MSHNTTTISLNAPIFYPGLNGLRAFAACLVVFAHISQALPEFHLDKTIFGVDPNGNPYGSIQAGIGVTVFFCLSGFLITSLLLIEKPSGINIRNFYIRRILRIWPLYFLYMGIVFLTMYLTNDRIVVSRALWYVFLCANIPFIFGGSIQLIIHFWSIGVEEQFYLFWPWVLKKVNQRKLLIVFVVLFAVLFALKIYLRWINIQTNLAWPFRLINTNRFDCMILGGIGALLYHQRHALFLRITTHVATQLLCWGVMIAFLLNFHFGITFNHEIAAACTLAIIIAQIENRNKLINLENRVFDFLGKISYGVYVYHPLVIFCSIRLIGDLPAGGALKYVLVYAFVFGATILTAFLSYHFFERRFLKIKTRYSKVVSSGSSSFEDVGEHALEAEKEKSNG